MGASQAGDCSQDAPEKRQAETQWGTSDKQRNVGVEMHGAVWEEALGLLRMVLKKDNERVDSALTSMYRCRSTPSLIQAGIPCRALGTVATTLPCCAPRKQEATSIVIALSHPAIVERLV